MTLDSDPVGLIRRAERVEGEVGKVTEKPA